MLKTSQISATEKISSITLDFSNADFCINDKDKNKMNKNTTTLITADRDGITKSIVSSDTVKKSRRQYKKFNADFLAELNREEAMYSLKAELMLDAEDAKFKAENDAKIEDLTTKLVQHVQGGIIENADVRVKPNRHFYNGSVIEFRVTSFKAGNSKRNNLNYADRLFNEWKKTGYDF